MGITYRLWGSDSAGRRPPRCAGPPIPSHLVDEKAFGKAQNPSGRSRATAFNACHARARACRVARALGARSLRTVRGPSAFMAVRGGVPDGGTARSSTKSEYTVPLWTHVQILFHLQVVHGLHFEGAGFGAWWPVAELRVSCRPETTGVAKRQFRY